MGAFIVRGLVASSPLPSGTPVISVPISSTLRDDRTAAAYPGAPWNACLAAHLLVERSRGTSSSVWPYLATLPADCSSPLLLPEQLLPEVQYAPAMAAIAAFQAFARESYEAWCVAAGQQQQQQQQQQQHSWADWCWALHMVQSRSIRLAITGCKVMVPGIDLLNHGASAANGQLVLGKASWQLDGQPAVVFVTTQDIAAGQQVLWSYGSRSNDDFFTYHGFALPDNPDEDVVLFESAQQLADWAIVQLPGLQALRQQQQHSLQQLAAVAEAAAGRAQQEAAARCSSAAIPGTTSSLLMPLQPLVQQQQQVQLHGSSEGAVLAAIKAAALQRRLASFRLHRSEWGTPSCPPAAPELVLKGDGSLDVRVPAVLAALQDLSAADAAGGARGLQLLLTHLLVQRCRELLAGFGSSLQEDDAWLQQDGSSSGEALRDLMCAVVQYRRGKKQVLQGQLDSLPGHM